MKAQTFALALALGVVGCKTAEPLDPDGLNLEKVELPLCMNVAEEAVMEKAAKINDTAEIIDSLSVYGEKTTSGDIIVVSISDDTEPSDYIVITEREAGKCSIKYIEMIASGILPQAEEATASCSAVVTEHIQKTNAKAQISGQKVFYGDKNTYGNAILVRVSDDSGKSDYAVVTKSKSGSCEVTYAEKIAAGSLPAVEGL
ncbi:MAG: hypothetical protein AB7T49_04825 [Oligoflexales bacterium]